MEEEQMKALIPAFREIGCAMLDDIEFDIISMEWENEDYKLIISVRIERKSGKDGL